jgi:hypothetical protein
MKRAHDPVLDLVTIDACTHCHNFARRIACWDQADLGI